jgi:hypothetical protein
MDTFLLFFLLPQVIEDLFFHAHDHVGIHLHKTAIGIIGEAFITALGDDPLDGDVIEPEIENRIHHARHGGACTGTDRDQQRIVRVAELLAHQLFDLFEIGGNFGDK